MLAFIIVGLVTGSIYGLAGVGLVLTYRTTGILNFAHGAIGAAAAYLFYDLHVTHDVPWPIAAVVAIGLFGPAVGLIIERVTRGLGRAPVATIIVATIGLLIATQGLMYIVFGDDFHRFPQVLPEDFVTISGVQVTYAQMITVAITVAITAGLSAFLRFSRSGRNMRAVVHSPELLDLTGTPPAPVRILAWCIGCTMAALSGVLIAPTITLDAALLSLLVVQAFGAVALGRFESLWLTYAGGLGIGVTASLLTKYFGDRPPLNGLPSSVPFIVLVAVLMLVPARRLPVPLGRIGGSAPSGRGLPPIARGVLLAAGAAAVVIIPFTVGPRLPVYTNALIFVILFLSLAMLLNTSGQISLCHAAFVAIGASTFSHLTADHGFPWLLALLGAGLVVVPVGALLSLPAIRLSGLYLALATFGFGILMQQVVYGTFLMFGDRPFLQAPRPQFAGIHGTGDRTFYFVVLALVVVSAVALTAAGRARLGRLLRAMSDSQIGLTTNGLSVNVSKILVFSISAFFAGISGALFIALSGTASRDVGYGPLQSLTWLAVLAICGGGLVLPSALAAVALVIVPSYFTGISQNYQLLIFGLGATVVSLVARSGIDWPG
ncbi:MAG TPA: ABC transporter permease, partial [Sporichthyaceae bacterium]|nr:ABC transporter permease [Sporichthyaceae bacterium]